MIFKFFIWNSCYFVTNKIFTKLINYKFYNYLKSLSDYNKRIYLANGVSLFHACLLSYEGLYCFDLKNVLIASSAYFFYDTIIQKNIFSLTTFHHICGFFLCISGIYAEELKLFEIIRYFLLCEISTVFLCLGTIYRGHPKYKIQNQNQNVIKFLFLSFALTFFITRILIMPYYAYIMFRDYNEDIEKLGKTRMRILVSGVLFLQFFWFRKIVKKLKQ